MQTIFNQSAAPRQGVLIAPQWTTIRQGLNRNLNQVVFYYQTRNLATKNNHFLVKLLGALKTSFNKPVDRFYENVDASTPSIAMLMKMTSSVHAGEVFDGIFYGHGSKEIIIANSETFDFTAAVQDWKNLAPVKVLLHPKTDLESHVPTGTSYSSERGLAVISINVPMLAVMYYLFAYEQAALLREGKTPATASQFIHTYVLPNMLASHLDIAVMNRMVALSRGNNLAKPIRRHAQHLLYNVSQADKSLLEIGNSLKKNYMSLHDMLCSVPSVTAMNGYEALRMPELAPTRQYKWAEMAARIGIIAEMMYLSPNNVPLNDKGSLQLLLSNFSETGSLNEFTRKLDKASPETIEAYEAVRILVGSK